MNAEEIFNNYINGNKSDFRTAIKKLNKKHLLCIIDEIIGIYGYQYDGKDILRIFIINL